MPVSNKEYKLLRSQHEAARTERDRAQGQLDAAMKTLREEFDCEDINEAHDLLARLDREAEEAEADYEKAKAAFEKDWGERFGED